MGFFSSMFPQNRINPQIFFSLLSFANFVSTVKHSATQSPVSHFEQHTLVNNLHFPLKAAIKDILKTIVKKKDVPPYDSI